MRSLFPFLVLALITLAACADPEPSTPPAGDEPSEDPTDEGFALTAPAEGEDSDLPLADRPTNRTERSERSRRTTHATSLATMTAA